MNSLWPEGARNERDKDVARHSWLAAHAQYHTSDCDDPFQISQTARSTTPIASFFVGPRAEPHEATTPTERGVHQLEYFPRLLHRSMQSHV